MNIIFERQLIAYTPPKHIGGTQNLICTRKFLQKKASSGRGYFSGQGTGIVTVAGKPAKREIWLFSLLNNKITQSTWSAHDGTYFFGGLDPEQEYLIICRDYERERAPFAWDYRLPATEMTLREQLDLLKERGFEIYDHDNPI